MSLQDDNVKELVVALASQGVTQRVIAEKVGTSRSRIGEFLLQKTYKEWWENGGKSVEKQGPKILTFDIETAPCKAYIWSQFSKYIPVENIISDWYIMSVAAKFLHEDEVHYWDKRENWDDEDDSLILKNIWSLLDKADIVVTQNGDKFDIKKLNSRFLANEMKPSSPFKSVDLLKVDKRKFGHTSNKLSYKTDKFCKKYKKLHHEKFPGMKLWTECLKGNMEAWQEMEDYNIHDTLSTEELYLIYLPWIDNHPNINLHYEDKLTRCRCGSLDMEHNGYAYTNLSKFDLYTCNDCGASIRGRTNLISKEKRQTLRMNII
jgi:DNA polymerase elongation subunit (family B)